MPIYLINDMTTWSVEAESEEEALQLFLEDKESVAGFEDQDVMMVGEV